jgi:hypothetical protein
MIRREWFTEPWSKKDETKKLSTQIDGLCTTRFNNKTYAENKVGRSILKTECYYANPCTIKNVKQRMMYVLELNVEENKIMGIGRVSNVLNGDVYKIYEDESYNKRYFSGGYRIDVDELNAGEKEFITAMEEICFRGRGHLKRGHRMLSFPKRIIGQCLEHGGLDIVSEINKMFVRKYNNININNNNKK